MNKSQDAVFVNRTKLYRPLITTDYVSRSALEAGLEATVALPLTVLSAPAGYGKSTLVSHWLDTSDFHAAWLSLDESDTDTRTFLTYFVAALRTIVPDACKDTLNSIHAESLPPLPIIATQLSNDLDELDWRVILVLDDYHRIGESDVHQLIDRLLEHPPRNLHLVILARRDPSLSLASLRAYHLLNEIRMRDLKFSSEDTLAFLELVIEQPLEASTIKKFQDSTEGWPVSIRLAALALQHQDDIEGFLNQFSPETQSLQDYLVQEVLSGLSPMVRNCLLSTSILDRFNASLCETLWDADDESEAIPLRGKAFIEILEKSGLFCIALDEQRNWFRFHHLFGDLLQHELEETLNGQQLSSLHRRASHWFKENGYFEEAIEHALSGKDGESAVKIVGTARHDLMNQDQWHRLERWLKLFSVNAVQQHANLLLLRCWLDLYHWYRLDSLLKGLDRVDALLDASTHDASELIPLKAEAAAIRTNLDCWTLNAARSVELARQTLRDTPDDYECVRSTAVLGWGAACQILGEIHECERVLWDHLEDGHFNNPSSRARLLWSMCISYWPQAEPQKLQQAATSLLEIGLEHKLSWSQSFAHYYLGLFHFDRNELNAAVEHFEIIVGDSYRYPIQNLTHCSFLLSLCYQAQGLPDRAREIANSIYKLTFERGNKMFVDLAEAFIADLDLRQGRIAQASRWAQGFVSPPPHSMPRFFNSELTFVRAMIAQNTPESRKIAAERLDSLHDILNGSHHRRLMIDVLGLKALLADARGELDGATALLKDAVLLGQAEQFIRPLANLGPGLIKLLNRLDLDPEGLQYVGSILSALSESDKAIGVESGNEPLLEVLSRRELEILELFARNLSSKEIAEQLFISPGTVKRHAHNIMGKLSVSSRQAAVSKATGLGILKTS
jgi:LuxR family maltose regulon positive regulatory protein